MRNTPGSDVLYDDIWRVIDQDTIPAARRLLEDLFDERGEPSPDLVVTASPRLDCVADIARREIRLSSGVLVRLAIGFQLFESMWEARRTQQKLVAVTQQSAWVDYLFFHPKALHSFNFRAVPDIAPLFSEEYSDPQLMSSLSTFWSLFAMRHGGGQGLLQFDLPADLSPTVRRHMRVAAAFLAAHEGAHLLLHRDVTHAGHGDSVSLESLSKAIEIEADGLALTRLIKRLPIHGASDIAELLTDVLYPVFICLAAIDLGRRSLHDYRRGSHPLPDLRAICACDIANENLEGEGLSLAEPLATARDAAALRCQRSFQYVGVPVGAFYVYGNRFVTVDTQFTAELLALVMLRTEQRNIEHARQRIRRHRGEFLQPPWPEIPLLGRSAEDTKATAVKAATRLLSGGNAEPDAGAAGLDLDAVRQLHGLEEGDLLLVMVDEDRRSPFFDVSTGVLVDLNSPLRAELDALLGEALELLFQLAGARRVT